MGHAHEKAPVAAALDRLTIRIVDVPGKGRGVVAARRIERGELIERAPVVPVPASQVATLEATALAHYVYDWADGGVAVTLGWGSIYNHSYTPNARYVKRFDENAIEYVAAADIEAGAEITINYNGSHPDQMHPLWFDVVD